jgi:hypothetical protein
MVWDSWGVWDWLVWRVIGIWVERLDYHWNLEIVV